MEEQIKCPVCGRPGIPDYHKEKVVCETCGTDLSIYKMLHESHNVSPTSGKNKSWKIATAAIAAVAVISLIFNFIPKSNTVVDNGLVQVYSDSINLLKIQLSDAKLQIEELKSARKETSEDIITYVVVRNDSPCRISKKVFGTERRYKEIEALLTKRLEPGDTLIIKK